MILRSPYNYDRNVVSDETALYCKGPGRTQQAGKDEADINVIVRRFGVTGQLPQNLRNPAYIDFDGVFDYQSALAVVADAKKAFMMVPADVRRRFHDNPQEYVAFCSDPANLDELRKLGLALPKAVVDTAPVVAPTA